jgi:catechol 2,3-dioxygenase-like lactoylglutathione lyase family enzyme
MVSLYQNHMKEGLALTIKPVFNSVVPVLRILDVAKAKAFYVDFLGLTLDWEHRFEEHLPLYFQVSLGNVLLHLSEHKGDCSPGSYIRIQVKNIEDYHAMLVKKKYNEKKLLLEDKPWNAKEMDVIDPFGNNITFYEYCV